MNDLPDTNIFGSELWKPALEKYGCAVQATVELFDRESRVVLGPIHGTRLFELFQEKRFDPGLFSECARRCLTQVNDRSSLIVSRRHGLTVLGTSLALDGKIVGAAVAGYFFADFSQISEIQGIAHQAGIGFEELWRVAREQKPVPQSRMTVNGELLQVLGDAILRENCRTREYEALNANLEGIVEHRTTALRKLSANLLRAQDKERRRIARELHDSLGQYLTHVKMSIESLIRKPETSENGARQLSEIAGELGHCLSEIRTMSYLLHPPLLDVLGFASAANSYVEGFSQRSGIQTKLRIPSKLRRLPDDVELVLFRTLQESLTNVLRHANSQSVDVLVTFDDDRVGLEVRDYGKGMPPELLNRLRTIGESTGVGISAMRERIRQLDGRLDIQSDENGTSVRASLPLPLDHSQETAKAVANSRRT
ncbi:MAG TPA: sensor histidine kinase [Terriglobia bacterium]|nr:sensor histidine kinase [Terriglobia bacterium]